MNQNKVNKPLIEIVSADETQVTYRKIPSKKATFKKKPASKEDKNANREVTLLLFDEDLADEIQEALERIISEKRILAMTLKKSPLQRLSTFLLR